MSILAREVDRIFIDGLEVRFARLYPGAEGLRERIIATIGRAGRYGITKMEDVDWFVGLDFARGFEWERAPDMDWAMDILDNPAVDLTSRRYRLEKWMRRWDGDAG